MKYHKIDGQINTGCSEFSPVLEVRNLKIQYQNGRKTVTAVNGISFFIQKESTLGLVGESGCGKTSTGMAIVKLIPVQSGEIKWQGKDIIPLTNREFRPYRKKIQIIFQNPDSSLNPKLLIRKSLQEALALGHSGERRDWDDIIEEKLRLVGLPVQYQYRYPHEFSGGQLQRVGIARALCVEPELIICDEPVSSLDVSIQAQILNLLKDLQDKLGLSYLFISHDLNVIRHISHDVAVMNQGNICEAGKVDEIFNNPQNEYTRNLLDAIPGKKVL